MRCDSFYWLDTLKVQFWFCLSYLKTLQTIIDFFTCEILSFDRLWFEAVPKGSAKFFSKKGGKWRVLFWRCRLFFILLICTFSLVSIRGLTKLTATVFQELMHCTICDFWLFNHESCSPYILIVLLAMPYNCIYYSLGIDAVGGVGDVDKLFIEIIW